MDVLAIVIGVSIVMFNGTALISFWGWTRSKINRMDSDVAVLKSDLKAVHRKCDERKETFTAIFSKLDEVNKNIGGMRVEVGERLSTLEAKIH